MKYITYSLLAFLIGLVLLLPSTSLAFSMPTFGNSRVVESGPVINKNITLNSDGSILVNDKVDARAKLDFLNDKTVFRYQLLDRADQNYEQVVIRVQLPPGVTTSQVKPNFIAVHGIENSSYLADAPSTVIFRATGLGPEATVTATIDLPVNAFQLSFWRRIEATVSRLPFDAWLIIALALPGLMVVAALGVVVQRWPDVALWPVPQPVNQLPAQLPPAYVGALIHGYVGIREIAATLIDLAKRDYIDIILRDDGSFGFSQKKQWQRDRQLQPFEKKFLEQLFTGAVVTSNRQLDQRLNQHVWSQSVSEGIESIYEQMVQLGYFPTNPRQAHLKVRFVGIVIFFLSVIGLFMTVLFFNQQPLAIIPWLVSMICSPVIIRLALVVPRRTAAGREQARAWLGFKRFLTEPTVANFSDQAEIYEQYLSYAIVFRAEAIWTQRFSNLPCRVPTWFYSEGLYITSYPQLAGLLFSVIGFVSKRFSFSRRPTAV